MTAVLFLILALGLLILPVWLVVKVLKLSSEQERFQRRIAALEADVAQQRQPAIAVSQRTDAPTKTDAPASPVGTVPLQAVPPLVKAPPPLQPVVLPKAEASMPRPVQQPAAPPSPPLPPPVPEEPAINWEQFMGAKLFAWLGGFAAFLAVAFFVKYSFEHDLIPPQVRVALGYLLSAGLIVGGLMIKGDKLRITSHVLCATGVVSLYAVTFAGHSVYHFAFFGATATFLLMAFITAAAFLLAVRLQAQVVALLGLLAGFLTPVLLSTGQDNPLALFGYIALLDLGLITVALHQRWFHLVPLAAGGTVLMQIGWAQKFFDASKGEVAVAICLGFCAVFFGAAEMARRFRRSTAEVTWSAVALPLVAIGFALLFLTLPALATRPGLLLLLVFAADLFLLALAWRNEQAIHAPLIGGAAVFVVLACWTAAQLTNAMLPWALAAYLLFAILHTAFPLVLQRLHPERATSSWSELFPPLALLLVLGPLLKFDDVSLLLWPTVLLVDVVAVALALFTTSLIALAVVLTLTVGATAICILKTAEDVPVPFALFLIIGGFAVFFVAAGLFLARKFKGSLEEEADGDWRANVLGGPSAQIPACAALLPFVLLIMMSQRLSLANPSSLFGLALLLNVLVLGLARGFVIGWLPLCALIGTTGLEASWHTRLFAADSATTALVWYLAFYAIFAAYPFIFRRHFTRLTGPWAVAALSGVGQFWLVYDVVRRTWPSDFPGLLPALFALVPLGSLVAILRLTITDPAKRLNQLAWFGGIALLFITLIFPIQFERQWITLGWALEGVALLWLYHRLPHGGLRLTGMVLLFAAFTRLALNDAVLTYHVRSATPLFNWYLYAYGVTALCLFGGARLLAPPRDEVLGSSAPGPLNTLGTILTFLLLNLEIADYFSAPGSTLTFQFSGSFARDLAYTIGWALFALALLGTGIWKQARAARIAALALLSVTLLKLFVHDLAHLAQLYRVAALIGVAAVAIVASFLYQRFVPTGESSQQQRE